MSPQRHLSDAQLALLTRTNGRIESDLIGYQLPTQHGSEERQGLLPFPAFFAATDDRIAGNDAELQGERQFTQ